MLLNSDKLFTFTEAKTIVQRALHSRTCEHCRAL